ncbi:hypothetical protein EON80_15990, partial [bacterium]
MTRTPNLSTREDEILRDLLKDSLPDDVPSTALSDRIAAMAVAADAKQQVEAKLSVAKPRFCWPRFQLALSAATVMFLIAAASLLWPRVMVKQAMARVEAAMAKVTSAHMTRWQIKNGKRVNVGETWFQNGQWRVEGEAGAFAYIYKNGTTWSYNPVENTVTKSLNTKGPFAHNPSGFTFDAMVRDFEAMGDKTAVTLLNEENLNGRSVK